MNTNTHSNSDKKIDATLRLLAQARPMEDFEQRLRLRLSQEAARSGNDFPKSFIARVSDFFMAERLAFAAPAVALACIAMIVGSIQHSRQHLMPGTGVHLAAPNAGLGAASSTHLTSQPVIAPEHGRSRSEKKAVSGRATVSRNVHKPAGVAVPSSTEPEKP
jgi:negative regulator of sigma E activity